MNPVTKEMALKCGGWL